MNPLSSATWATRPTPMRNAASLYVIPSRSTVSRTARYAFVMILLSSSLTRLSSHWCW